MCHYNYKEKRTYYKQHTWWRLLDLCQYRMMVQPLGVFDGRDNSMQVSPLETAQIKSKLHSTIQNNARSNISSISYQSTHPQNQNANTQSGKFKCTVPKQFTTYTHPSVIIHQERRKLTNMLHTRVLPLAANHHGFTPLSNPPRS